MSDKVQKNMENMVQELQNFKKQQLFSESEITQIINTRRKYEYALQRSTKKLFDYLRYIEHEMKILEKLPKDEKNCFSIIRRIIHLFKNALDKFPDDKRLLVQFVDFSVSYCKEELHSFFEKMCLLDFKNYELWIFAGETLFQNGLKNEARSLMQKAVKANDIFEVWLSWIKMEDAVIYDEKILNEENGLNGENGLSVENIIFCLVFKEIAKKFENRIDDVLNVLFDKESAMKCLNETNSIMKFI